MLDLSKNSCNDKLSGAAMKTVFTSDHHFGHWKMIKYSNRPFNSVAHMDSMMAYHWNRIIDPDDTVYYLGDFVMNPRQLKETLAILNGNVHFVFGNHDLGHPKIGSKKWREEYLSCGFASVQTELELEIAGQKVLLHHFPYRNDKFQNERYHGVRPVNKGGWLIHGHVHHRWQVKDKQINVGVDAWNFEPVTLETIAALIETGPVIEKETGTTQPW
jgi:calcineurin-like phosphoesterase family protein